MKRYTILAMLFTFSALASAQTNFIPTITIGRNTFTNCTLKAINSTNGILSFSGGGAKISLSDLPEPWRSRYYDEDKVKKERQVIKEASDRRQKNLAKKIAEAAERNRTLEAEANKPDVSNEWIEVSRGNGKADRFGGLTISGTLRNKSSRDLRGVVITYSIYDNAHNKIDEARDYVSSIAPGEAWKFEAVSLSKVGPYSLNKVTSRDGRLD